MRDEAIAYAERLQAAGISVKRRTFDSLGHGHLLMTGLCRASFESTVLIAREVGAALRA